MTELILGRTGDRIRQRVVYGPRGRPLVDVRVGDHWVRGRLCYRVEGRDGAWSMRVTYRSPGDTTTLLGRFAAADIRPAARRPQVA